MTRSRGVRRRYAPEVTERVLQLQREGKKRREIAALVEIPLTQVHKILRRAGATLTNEQRRVNVAYGRKLRAAVYPPGTTENILELHRAGHKRRDIAVRLGLSVHKVNFDIRRYSEYRLTRAQRAENHRRYTVDLRAKVVDCRRSGMSLAEVARKLGIRESTARYFAGEAGVTLSPEARSKNRRRLDHERLAKLLRDLREDPKLTNTGAAHTLGISLSTVKALVAANDLYMTPERYRARYALPEELARQIVELRGEGVKCSAIAERVGVERHAIAKYLFDNRIRRQRSSAAPTRNAFPSTHGARSVKPALNETSRCGNSNNIPKRPSRGCRCHSGASAAVLSMRAYTMCCTGRFSHAAA